MAYTADKPDLTPSREELKSRIPGWGADLDPADRPSFPRESRDLRPEGATWDFPDRQEPSGVRERSIEHKFLTPVFGTAQPLTGLSGKIRWLAYDRYSEGRAAHWLLLILGDRVDATGAHLRSLLTLRPDNPITETGVMSEVKHHPIRSRRGLNRADTKHAWIDPVLVAGPWVVAGLVAFRVFRKRR
jgi:hypothetical protein